MIRPFKYGFILLLIICTNGCNTTNSTDKVFEILNAINEVLVVNEDIDAIVITESDCSSCFSPMEASWCAEVLQEAINKHGKPEIINTDQGSQFTAEVFTQTVLSNDIKMSMDGKGRAIDNVFIQRLWRSVKYESVYLNPPNSGIDLYKQLKQYFDFYNNTRRHQGIDNQIPFKRYLIKQQKAA